MKKTVKSNPLKTFNDNKALAVKKMGGAQAAFKKSLPKAQVGQSVGTPFQDYMKIPGAVASDTIVSRKPMGTTPQKTELYYREMLEKPSPKNPKNKGTLVNAIEKTYGMDVWNRPGPQGPTNKKNLTPSQDKEMRRMGPNKQKMGGATKATKFAALAPPYNKATAADRIAGAKKNKKK